MGDFNINAIESDRQRGDFYHKILRDLEAFEFMLNEGLIEQRSDMIGAEQELCIIDDKGMPSPVAINVLKKIKDKKYTNELALYNLEINLSPQKLTGDCFSKVESELIESLKHGKKIVNSESSKIFLAGILPTLHFRHLSFAFMTPEERYKVLSNELLNLRGSHFEIYLQGVDEFHATLNSVLFEACNTSFQLHLQIDPREFDMMHNWSQMISGPVLAACTNSPLLFGKELWAENRIALFKQSLDTRNVKNHSRTIIPRVYFGNKWRQGSPGTIWRNEVLRFPLILRGEGDLDPMQMLKDGQTPSLRSVRLHNGTTYTWNRLCYGVNNNVPHIRIECRYLPAGPTLIDEMANFALWIGVMKGLPDRYKNIHETVPFQIAKSNFIKAARTGMQTVFDWMGKYYSTAELYNKELLPIAREGLKKMNVNSSDIDRLLGVIEERVNSQCNGSSWQIINYRNLKKHNKPSLASQILVTEMLERQCENLPVHKWTNISSEKFHSLSQANATEIRVEDMMNKDVISIKENTTVEIARAVLSWKSFNHLPVESLRGNLVGIVSSSLLEKCDDKNAFLRDIMIKKVISVNPYDLYVDAIKIMKKENVGSLIVTEDNKLIGIITKSDQLQ